jgi:F0F1-type ATP synthase assembly protein I
VSFIQNYIIPTPFKLDWAYVSPSDNNGFDYHLSPDLTVRIEGLFSGRVEFIVPQHILAADGIKVAAIEAEHIWKTDYMPGKTNERIQRFFKEGNMTCFFTKAHIDWLVEAFDNNDEHAYTSSNVSVLYKGRAVDDIVELPPAEFKMVMEVFDELNVQATIDFRASRETMEEDYQKAYEKKTAERERHSQQSAFDKLKNKGMRKRIAIAIGASVLGVCGHIFRRRLAGAGPWGIAAAILVGTLGIVFDVYGKQELTSVLQSILSKSDRGMFV